MTIALIQFLGSNCDRDCSHVLQNVLHASVDVVWHDRSELPAETTGVLIPGGFSYGDYLRAGAIAAQRPIMAAIRRFADRGGSVLGICNGFQILCEAHILPGALVQNVSGKFVCRDVSLKMDHGGLGLLKKYNPGEVIKLPIAHREGRFIADDETLAMLEKDNRIACRYIDTDENGDAAVNGSKKSIAGIFGGPNRNVLGLMPHPERCAEERLGGTFGLRMLEALAYA